MRDVEKLGHWAVRSSVLMPDHLHIVITLGMDGRLAECIRCFKGSLSPLLRAHGLRWQEGFYDHRLRSEDELLPTFLYVFLNPYRAKLAQPTQKWPWYECALDDWEWFGGLTNEATPFPEWLR
jgi:REP element-mobilizing transposase RayT